MSLPGWVAGATRPSLLITWYEKGTTTPLDLTDATITALRLNSATNDVVAMTGTFTVTDAANGVFRWDFSAADVATVGTYFVQFTAIFGSDPTTARTFKESWSVADALMAT